MGRKRSLVRIQSPRPIITNFLDTLFGSAESVKAQSIRIRKFFLATVQWHDFAGQLETRANNNKNKGLLERFAIRFRRLNRKVSDYVH